MTMMLRPLFIFVVAFVFNVAWENLHAVLYANYKGGSITEKVLLHATFIDALIITGCFFLVMFLPSRFAWYVFATLLLGIAIGIEWWALSTLRWSYRASMILVPLIKTGVSPTLQLTLTGSLAWFLVSMIF